MGFVDKIFRKGNENSRSKAEEITTTNKPEDLLNTNDATHSLNANNDATSYVESQSTRINWSSLYKKEDWWAVWIGLTIFALSLPSYAGFYTLGWVPVAKPWLYISHALTTKLFNPWIGLVASFIFLALLLIPVTRLNGVKSKDWFKGFFVIFFAAWGIWILSNYAPVVKAIGSAEVGYIIALLVGIVVTNVMRIPSWLKD